jgi:hypothetical protein
MNNDMSPPDKLFCIVTVLAILHFILFLLSLKTGISSKSEIFNVPVGNTVYPVSL